MVMATRGSGGVLLAVLMAHARALSLAALLFACLAIGGESVIRRMISTNVAVVPSLCVVKESDGPAALESAAHRGMRC